MPEQRKADPVQQKRSPDECAAEHSDAIRIAIRRNPEQDVGKLYKLYLKRQRPHLDLRLNASELRMDRAEK